MARFWILIVVNLLSGFAARAEKITANAQVKFANYNYSEPGLMQLDGQFIGVGVKSRFELPQMTNINLFVDSAQLRLEIMRGELKYSGRLQDGTPHSESTNDYIIEGQGDLRKSLQVNESLTFADEISPKIGLGYRYLNNKGQSGHSYEREQTYLFFPLGLDVNKTINAKLQVGVGLEYRQLIYGRNESHIENVYSDVGTQKLKQHAGHGTKLALNANLKGLQNRDLLFEFFRETWSIEKSDTSHYTRGDGRHYTFYEPANETEVYGINLGISF